MKYIKKFNEELDLRTYRNAAGRLDYYNKTKRASTLYDYADDKEHGFYNMLFVSLPPSSGALCKESTFTDPKLIGIYYGGYDCMRPEYDSTKYNVDAEQLAENLVESWVKGEKSLSISFEFGFRATRKTKTENSNSKQLLNPVRKNNTGYLGGSIPAFSLEITLSEWNDGINDWDADARWEAERSGEEFKPSDIFTFYDWSRCITISLFEPDSPYAGIFTDRKSGLKFRNWLNTQDKIKESIMNVLRIVGGDSDNLDSVMNSLNNIRLVGLYDDDYDPRSQTSIKQKWFDKELK
jgi:hypothetical protein